ncbi:hypothetical protein P3L10_032158 [Capsicum annuum]
MSNKDIESDIMDQTKSHENESSKQEIRRLRQQMTQMHRAWASGLPSPLFSAIDPTNTSSFPLKLQSQCPTVVDAPQHDSKFILSQKHHNTSTTFPRAPQYKPATFTTPHVFCDIVAQSPTEVSTLANRPTVVLPHDANGPLFNTLGDHHYTTDPTFTLTGPPKLLNKKFSVPEKPEKMVGKMKSAVNVVKSSLRLASKEDVSYKNRDVSSSVNPPPNLEISKFEEQDGQKEFMKYLEQYCNQLKDTGGEKNGKDTTVVIVGERAHPRRRRCCRYHLPTPQTYQSPSRPDFRFNPNNEIRQKLRDSFTPIGELYASLFQRLVQWGMITHLLGHTLNPRSRNFDPNARCAYHFDARGHSIKDYRDLKREIEKMIQDGSIMV